MAQFVVTSWGCGQCGYSQDFSPSDEQKWETHITSDQNLQRTAQSLNRSMPPQGKCPACWLGLTESREVRDSDLDAITDLSSPVQMTVADDEELENRKTAETDEQGIPVMVKTRERFEQQFNPDTGETTAIPVDVMEPKLVSIPEKELTELKEQAKRERDELSKVAVKEV